MKKLLSLALTLTLVLGLACPALATETDVIPVLAAADLTPEQVADIAARYELTPPVADEDYVEPADQYVLDHPDEIAALDIGQLLADWGYKDMTAGEAFMEGSYNVQEGDTLEEAVAREYADRRLLVEEISATAETYRQDHAEEWADFDPDACFEEHAPYGYADKDAYMKYYCIHTQEEFADDVFVWYVDYMIDQDDWSWDDPYYGEDAIYLMVNGEYTDVEVSAEDGVTYADAADLREIFGAQTVPSEAVGLLPIRETAKKAGWDVGWYGGAWWDEPEVQLWDKASYEAEVGDNFDALNDFLAKAAKLSWQTLFAETPTSTHQTVTIDVTRFSTLDGDETVKLTFDVDTVMGGGVLDATVTFDLSQLLKLFNTDVVENLIQYAGFSVTQLNTFLKGGTMEFIIDYNTGKAAYNIPLLALLDEDMAGWQSVEGVDVFSSLDEAMDASFTSSQYAQMLTRAEINGAWSAANSYEQTVTLLNIFAGKDRFSTDSRGKTTYSLTTQAVNEALSALLAEDMYYDMEEELPTFSFFKAFDLTLSLDDNGNETMDLHIRMDADGITSAMMAGNGGYDPYFSLAGILSSSAMRSFDMDITATASTTASRSVKRADVHWNNVGKMAVRSTATRQNSRTAPRNVEDVVK